jgi:hypothetical protein
MLSYKNLNLHKLNSLERKSVIDYIQKHNEWPKDIFMVSKSGDTDDFMDDDKIINDNVEIYNIPDYGTTLKYDIKVDDETYSFDYDWEDEKLHIYTDSEYIDNFDLPRDKFISDVEGSVINIIKSIDKTEEVKEDLENPYYKYNYVMKITYNILNDELPENINDWSEFYNVVDNYIVYNAIDSYIVTKLKIDITDIDNGIISFYIKSIDEQSSEDLKDIYYDIDNKLKSKLLNYGFIIDTELEDIFED